MSAEAWRGVVDFPEFEVSNLGQVRDAVTKELVQVPLNSNGYYRIRIYRSGAEHRKYVHAAVCEAFNGDRPQGFVCRHLNGNPLDNRAANLAWGTQSENMYDVVAHGYHHEAIKTHCHRGHEFDAENTYITAEGNRRCRLCMRMLRRRYKAKMREKRMAERAVPVIQS